MAVVAGLLGLAVVVTAVAGVPVLLRRNHESDAIRRLAGIARNAAVYYVKPRVDESGGRQLCQFPMGEIRTTLAASCCDPSVNDGHGLCDPKKIEWNRTLLNLLHFEVDEAQPYVFAYEGHGTLGQARFTVSAYADLDCDGQVSTFRFVGHGDARSSATDCLIGDAPLFEAVHPDE